MVSIVSRAGWGARAPRFTSTRTSWKGVTVHHSAGPYGQSIRQIQDYHMDSNGWPDVGYNFLIKEGRIFEGRGWSTHPAHDGINDTLGVCVVGNYMKTLPSDRDLDALSAFIGEAQRRTGTTLARGHRDVAQTACPGDKLYAWVKNRRYLEDDVSAKEVWEGHYIDKIDEESGSSSRMRPSSYLAYTHHYTKEIKAGQAAIMARLDGSDDEQTQEIVRAELERAAERERQERAAEFAELVESLAVPLGDRVAARLGDIAPAEVGQAVAEELARLLSEGAQNDDEQT